MNCELVIRSRNSILQWDTDDWTALVTIAILSAEPETDAELIAALRRYGVEHRRRSGSRELSGLPHWDPSGKWCVIDLIGKSVILGSDMVQVKAQSVYDKEEDDPEEGSSRIWISLPDDWLIERASSDWAKTVQTRFAARSEQPPCDARAVLMGQPLFEHLVAGFETIVRTKLPKSEWEQLQATRKIHADWLMTSRADLNGLTPRELLLAKQEGIDNDMLRRTHQWSREKQAPPPLDVNSNAYRYSGFGIIQIVFYFDLVRSLLEKLWELARQRPSLSRDELIQRLAAHQERWLDRPNDETGANMTPRKWMEAERIRLPVTTSAEMIDCDCPICQAQADGAFGLGFMMFDGHHLELEGEFAFSTLKNRELWESGPAQYAADTLDPQVEPLTDDEQDVEDDDEDDEEEKVLEDSVWQTTFVDWFSPPPPGQDPFVEGTLRIAFCLSEVIAELKGVPGGGAHIVKLNDSYREFRRSQSSAEARRYARQLCAELEIVAAAYSHLAARSSDLQSRIHEVARWIHV